MILQRFILRSSSSSGHTHHTMPTKRLPAQLSPGDVLLVDWRERRKSAGEANKPRPAVIVGGRELTSHAATLLLVPLSTDPAAGFRDFSLAVDGTKGNGLAKRSYALAHVVTGTARSRVFGYLGVIAPDQLATIRALVCAALDD